MQFILISSESEFVVVIDFLTYDDNDNLTATAEQRCLGLRLLSNGIQCQISAQHSIRQKLRNRRAGNT